MRKTKNYSRSTRYAHEEFARSAIEWKLVEDTKQTYKNWKIANRINPQKWFFRLKIRLEKLLISEHR